MSKAPCLEDRIALAFREPTTPAELLALITEVGLALDASGKAAERAKSEALHPSLTVAEFGAARTRMEDAAFRKERLEIALPKLKERLKEVRADEEDQRRQAEYESAKTERDALAAELVSVYPEMERRLVGLVSRMAASDRRIEHINAMALPRGNERLLFAELVARGRQGLVEDGLTVARITKELRLPAFASRSQRYAWPPPNPMFR